LTTISRRWYARESLVSPDDDDDDDDNNKLSHVQRTRNEKTRDTARVPVGGSDVLFVVVLPDAEDLRGLSYPHAFA